MNALESPPRTRWNAVPGATAEPAGRQTPPGTKPVPPTTWLRRHRTSVVLLILLLLADGVLAASILPRLSAPAPVLTALQKGCTIAAMRSSLSAALHPARIIGLDSSCTLLRRLTCRLVTSEVKNPHESGSLGSAARE